jgi:hypothetical protein
MEGFFMSIINKIWNSKTFETISEVNYEVLKGVGSVVKGVAEVGLEVLSAIAINTIEVAENRRSVEEETYEYWKGLSYREQQDYFELNYKLQEYGENYRYDNNEQMAKSVAEIARRENRSFTDKYDRF